MADDNSQEEIWRVIKILDEYRVLINAGTDEKINEGDHLKILGTTEEIIDPKTKRSLGKLEKVKARVEVIHTQKNMCVAENVETYKASPTDVMAGFVGTLSRSTTYLRRLPVKTGDISGGWENEEIKIGDQVKKASQSSDRS